MVIPSRKVRKQEAFRISVRRLGIVLLCVILLYILIASWYSNNIMTFTSVSVITFFGILFANPYNIKKIMPGLAATQQWKRLAITLIYLLVVMAVFSRINIQSSSVLP